MGGPIVNTTPPTLTIHVVGLPAPQGSKRAFVVKGRAVMTESSSKVKPWRQDVTAAVHALLDQDYIHLAGPSGGTIRSKDLQLPLAGPLELAITFYMPRPGYHFRTGRHAGELKPNAPTYVDKIPDLSKLVRSTEDALTQSGIWRDDAQVARLVVEKRYADAATGARISITPLITAEVGTSPAAASEEALF